MVGKFSLRFFFRRFSVNFKVWAISIGRLFIETMCAASNFMSSDTYHLSFFSSSSPPSSSSSSTWNRFIPCLTVEKFHSLRSFTLSPLLSFSNSRKLIYRKLVQATKVKQRRQTIASPSSGSSNHTMCDSNNEQKKWAKKEDGIWSEWISSHGWWRTSASSSSSSRSGSHMQKNRWKTDTKKYTHVLFSHISCARPTSICVYGICVWVSEWVRIKRSIFG